MLRAVQDGRLVAEYLRGVRPDGFADLQRHGLRNAPHSYESRIARACRRRLVAEETQRCVQGRRAGDRRG